MIFDSILFMDKHSESIENKNLIKVEFNKLYEYNALASIDAKEKGILRETYICTNYDESDFIPFHGLKEIPKRAINCGKCLLADRVWDSVKWIKKHTPAPDAFVILLGNVRSFNKNLIEQATQIYSTIKDYDNNISGLMSVHNMCMFNKCRAGRILSSKFNLADNIYKDDVPAGQEKDTLEEQSWFFDGGIMIMDANNPHPPKHIMNCYPTQFEYLGMEVVALRQSPCTSVELDAPWQYPLLIEHNWDYLKYNKYLIAHE